jgi:hypothetical protein
VGPASRSRLPALAAPAAVSHGVSGWAGCPGLSPLVLPVSVTNDRTYCAVPLLASERSPKVRRRRQLSQVVAGDIGAVLNKRKFGHACEAAAPHDGAVREDSITAGTGCAERNRWRPSVGRAPASATALRAPTRGPAARGKTTCASDDALPPIAAADILAVVASSDGKDQLLQWSPTSPRRHCGRRRPTGGRHHVPHRSPPVHPRRGPAEASRRGKPPVDGNLSIPGCSTVPILGVPAYYLSRLPVSLPSSERLDRHVLYRDTKGLSECVVLAKPATNAATHHAQLSF